MTTKLTVSIDKKVIKKAKIFAKKSNKSLSDMVESYLTFVISNEFMEDDEELNKIKDVIQLPEDFKEKEEIRNFMISRQV